MIKITCGESLNVLYAHSHSSVKIEFKAFDKTAEDIAANLGQVIQDALRDNISITVREVKMTKLVSPYHPAFQTDGK